MKVLDLFRLPTPGKKAEEELHEAQLELLKATTQAEYWDAQVAYNTQRVDRLKDFLGHGQAGAAHVVGKVAA